ncbi:uncharacterized protein LOC113468997 [Diaphorina citri]|uniref:Uncharacterized protein LOC113468997 n=1 Tax=Diaphorina citri TaxID=121845 RepID=A0A3Q0J5F2_DIACI|nr:uncharacterized protein LOC113468997 [Diaphorina citri]
MKDQDPVPHPGWSGERDATTDSPVCPQAMPYFPEKGDAIFGQEDWIVGAVYCTDDFKLTHQLNADFDRLLPLIVSCNWLPKDKRAEFVQKVKSFYLNNQPVGEDNLEGLIDSGKVMGGTTVLNGLMYCRGDSSDYDEYEKLGATGWGYKNVLPYFLKSEHNLQYNSSQNHARGGLLTVSHYNDLPDLGHTLLAAGRELGYPTDVDIGHGRLREGFYRAQMTTRNGARLSAAKAFVRPFLHRSNLKVLLNAQVMRVLFNEHNEAIGVQYMKNNRTHNLYAVKEVIISAGTIMSPVILMSSGIGNPDHLQEKELAVVDATLQVYGTRKLRVIDASVLPDVPSGNLMAPTIMVGEKGADHVKTTWSCTP